MRSLQLILLALLLWVLPSIASFVRSTSCASNISAVRLADFVMDVVITDDHRKLQFYITSQVINSQDLLDTSEMINDVNTTSNRWTNMHVEILFMGKQFINENVRFCDIANVKNTLEYLSSPRFLKPLPVSGPGVVSNTTVNINDKRELNKERDKRLDDEASLLPSEGWSAHTYNNSAVIQGDLSTNNVFNYTSTLAANHCPLYVNDTITFFYEADIEKNYHRLGSYTVKFVLISNEVESQIIACNKAYITPTQPESIYKTILIGVLCLLLVTGAINFFTVMYSSYQESSNPLLFTVSTIGNEKLLRQLECSVRSILHYLQFALFVGALDLQYPGFYQPLISQFKWCSLMGISLIGKNLVGSLIRPGPRGPNSKDYVYSTYNKRGLQSLTEYSTDRNSIDCWPNFMLALVLWCLIQILIKQLFIYIKEFINLVRGNRYMMIGRESRLDLAKNISLMLGEILNNFLNLFAFPFLTLTIYLFSEARDGERFFPFLVALSYDFFNPYTSYKSLFQPPPGGGAHTWEYKHANSTHPTHSSTSTASNMTLAFDSSPTNSPSFHGGNFTMNHNNSLFQRRATPDYAIPYRITVPAVITFTIWCMLALFFFWNYLFTVKKVFHRGRQNTIWEKLFPFRVCQNENVTKLYTSLKTILIWGFSYHHLEPSKVYYAMFPYVLIFLKLIVIGLLQSHGSGQVTALSIIEFLELLILVYYEPYVVKIKWYSPRLIIPLAKFIVTLLCIPYIRQLDLSEARRTYIAYVQLLIHVIVAVIFIVQLLYDFGKTLRGIIIESRKSEAENKAPIVKKTHPVEYRGIRKLEGESSSFEYGARKGEENLVHDHRIMNSEVATENGMGNEDEYYFRGAAAKRVDGKQEDFYNDFTEDNISNFYNKPERACFRNDSLNDVSDHLLRSVSDLGSSFHEQQRFSNKRRKENDYTFREGDVIYKKFLVDNSIDLEIKALWDLRSQNKSQNQNQAPAPNCPFSQRDPASASRLANMSNLFKPNNSIGKTNANSNSKNNPLSIFGKMFKKKKQEEPIKCFEIDRPRQLLIKTPEQMDQIHNKSMPSRVELPSATSSASLLSSTPEETYLDIDNQHSSQLYESADSLVIVEDNNRSDSWLFIPQQI